MDKKTFESLSKEDQAIMIKGAKLYQKLFEGYTQNKSDEECFFDTSKGMYIGNGTPINGTNTGEVFPIYIPWSSFAGHLSVYGTTRVGKTRLMVNMIDQCIRANKDLLIVEPKGSKGQETIAWILEFAEKAGRLRDIKYISPKFSEYSLCFNPLYGLDDAQISSMVSTLIPAKDDFFAGIGYQITMAILLALKFLEHTVGEEEVRQKINEEYQRLELEGNSVIFHTEEDFILEDDLATRVVTPGTTLPEDIEPPLRSLVTFADIAKYATQSGVQVLLERVENQSPEQFSHLPIKKQLEIAQLKKEAEKALTELANKPADFFSKVATSYGLVLQNLSTGDIGKIFCSIKVNPILDNFRNTTHGQILIVQPFPMLYKKASDTFVRVFFAMFTVSKGEVGASGRAFPRELFLFIDEGGSVLYPGVEQLFNKAGGLGLRICIFTQSFADLDAELGQEVAKIVNDNTNIKIYLKMNDENSREQISKSFGKIMVPTAGYGMSKIDIKVDTGFSETLLLLSKHIGELTSQDFLLQFPIGDSAAFLCRAPDQADPKYFIEMPKVGLEKLYDDFGSNYASIISETYKQTKKEFEEAKKEALLYLTEEEKMLIKSLH